MNKEKGVAQVIDCLPRKHNVVWSPSLLNFFKLIFDGSKLRDGNTAYDFIIRDIVGKVLICGANSIVSNNSILVAEAWGLREGIRG